MTTRIRVKNFSAERVQFDLVKRWQHPNATNDNFIEVVESHLFEPGEITEEFDPDDPYVQRMLKIHPELRAYVAPSIWERLRKPEF